MVKVSIFGLAGTGTSTAGRLLANKLNFSFISSGDMFRETAKSHNLSLIDFGNLCKKDSNFDKSLDKKVGLYGENNNDFVIDSRLAWFFIPDSFKVKLICDFETRIKRVAFRDGIDVVDARKNVINREKAEKIRYLDYYDIEDYTDDIHFDLIIDTTNVDADGVVDLIALKLNSLNNNDDKKL